MEEGLIVEVRGLMEDKEGGMNGGEVGEEMVIEVGIGWVGGERELVGNVGYEVEFGVEVGGVEI